MRRNLLFDFSVNKEKNTIHIKREFDQTVQLVWKAWTDPKFLDLWWAPKPWKARTKTMEFREGGFWLYAMEGPEGQTHWSKATYISIVKERSFSAKDGFCDENGTINSDFPQSVWENRFFANDQSTDVVITVTFDTLADLEQTISMGFKEGFTMGLTQLDELFNKGEVK